MYDYLVVGAGFFGSVVAHELHKNKQKVLVIDSRTHIGGNAYSKKVNGIEVHEYGPHIFHTASERIWNYINQFAKFNHFVNRPKAFYAGKLYSLPINLNTFYQVAGCQTPAEAQEYLAKNRVSIENPANLEEWVLSQVGEELYETLIKGYTTKQWKRHPKDLPASIIRRIPIRLTFDDNYYNDCYQGIPFGGYTAIFEKLLDGIDLELGVDFFKLDWRQYAKRVIYTGKIDALFDYTFGELEYRTLEFSHEEKSGDHQGNAIVNYTEENVPYTRIIEHKHFEFGKQDNTVITKEYPTEWDRDKVPYYPINDAKNDSLYGKYRSLVKTSPWLVIGGRLGSFRYFDMDQTIAAAINTACDLASSE